MSEKKTAAVKKIPTSKKVQTAIKTQAKKWITRAGMSTSSWSSEVTTNLGFGNAPDDTYREVRDLVDSELRKTDYLKFVSVCGSTAASVKPGTTF